MENIHNHVLEFVDSLRKLWRRVSLDAVRSGRLRTSAENIESVGQSFSRSPMKSIHIAARELVLPPTIVNKVLHKRLRLQTYKMQMLQRLQLYDKPKQKRVWR